MNNLNLQKLKDKAGSMALHNVWGENAYKINMAILHMDQNDIASYTRLAKYYRLNNDIEQAKEMYLKALGIDPANRGAINNLNDIERDQQEDAIVDKIETAGKSFQTGQSYMQKGKYKLALKLILKAYNMEPLLKYAVGLAGIYHKMGNVTGVEQLYKQLINSNNSEKEIETINSEFRLLRLKSSSVD